MPPENDVASLVAHFQILHGDVGEIKEVLKELSRAINRLALVEERQAHTSAAVERAFVAIERIEERLIKLEMAAPSARRTTDWVDRAVWAAAAAAVMFIAVKAGGKL